MVIIIEIKQAWLRVLVPTHFGGLGWKGQS